jgi:hypothetical protein
MGCRIPGGGDSGVRGGRKSCGGVKTWSGGPGVNGGASGTTNGGSRLVSNAAAGGGAIQAAGVIGGALASSIGRQAHSWGRTTGPT